MGVCRGEVHDAEKDFQESYSKRRKNGNVEEKNTIVSTFPIE